MYPQHYLQKQRFPIIRYRLMSFMLFVILCLPLTGYANVNDTYAVFTLNEGLNKLSKSKVRMLYRGKIKLLQGQLVELSDWPQKNNIRHVFYKNLLGKDIAQMNAYWASLSFSGKARPPKVIKDDTIKALLEWMSENPMRIGYAPMNLLPQQVNILYVVNGGTL